MPRRHLRRIFFGLACSAAAMLAPTACYRQATDESASVRRPRHAGTAPWTIDGVRPGQTIDEVQRALGQPVETRAVMAVKVSRWDRPNLSVTFDAAGRVTDVMGSSLKAGEQTLLWSGASETEVVQVLGRGDLRTSTRPRGGGVIALGSVETGRTLHYDNDGVHFELTVSGEAAGHFRAYRKP